MQTSTLLYLCLMVTLPCAWCKITLEAFGTGAGDRELADGADPSAKLTLQDKYVFFGQEYSLLCISDNGYVTLGDSLLSNIPKPFPITSGSYKSLSSKMIAPYWSDIDSRCGGHIYYREAYDVEQTDTLLYMHIVTDVFYAGVAYNFVPTSAVVVTWVNVRCQNGVPCTNDDKNSFQLILATDRTRTVVIFKYRKLEWQTSDMGKGPAWAGVNCGDMVNGFNVTSDVNDMLNMKLVDMTNCGVPGQFVYRVDPGITASTEAILMGEMIQYSMTAQSMEFGVAEAELYSPFNDVPTSQFNRKEDNLALIEGYVGGLTAETQTLPFIYYGHPEDYDLGHGDETTSGKFYFEKPVYYYGKVYNSAEVYTNGILALGDGSVSASYVPKELTSTNVPIVAPFFADVDTSGANSGSVYYRGTTDKSVLQSAKQTVSYLYPQASTFEPVYAFIATWDKVGYYRRHDDKLNSFQVIIVTDSKASYVIINYKRIQWTSPDSTGVSSGAGLGAQPARLPVMGISDGNSHQQLVDGTYSNEQGILSAAERLGNSGIPGVWVFEASSTPGPAAQNQQYADPKLMHKSSVEQQNIDSLASELQSVKKFVG